MNAIEFHRRMRVLRSRSMHAALSRTWRRLRLGWRQSRRLAWQLKEVG